MKYFIWFLVAALLVAHQDVWYWTDETLVFGFIPIGLFYHACISLAAGVTWFLATVLIWPKEESFDNVPAAGTANVATEQENQ